MKLSIITINLNNCEGLRKTIESVVCQTFTDYEYIIIDGKSTDGSTDVIKQYKDRITYWTSELDNGVYNAMNKGLLQAKGEYCLFLNSGDYLVDNGIIDTVFKLNLTESIVYGNLLLTGGRRENSEKRYPDRLAFSHFFRESLPHPASFIKRNLFDEIGYYDESCKIISDWAFFVLAICRYNCSYRHIQQIVSIFDETGISSSAESKSITEAEKNSFYEQYFPLFGDDYRELRNFKRSKLIRFYSKFKNN